jgi:hypothetical protein
MKLSKFISKLEVIFCAFLAENSFVNLLILFIRVREALVLALTVHGFSDRQPAVRLGGILHESETDQRFPELERYG